LDLLNHPLKFAFYPLKLAGDQLKGARMVAVSGK
jgi:hypothetical protein